MFVILVRSFNHACKFQILFIFTLSTFICTSYCLCDIVIIFILVPIIKTFGEVKRAENFRSNPQKKKMFSVGSFIFFFFCCINTPLTKYLLKVFRQNSVTSFDITLHYRFCWLSITLNKQMLSRRSYSHSAHLFVICSYVQYY